jgi:formamidopyrimidine-DNA glycosylase
MPELPEVEVLARHLRRVLPGEFIRQIRVNRARILRPTLERKLKSVLTGARFQAVSRRGKYLLFELKPKQSRQTARRGNVLVLGHLGMTGKMFLALKNEPPPKHAAVILDLGKTNFIFEDTRYFGRFTLDLSALENLGPEPLSGDFSPEMFAQALKRSRQPVKIKLLDQSMIAGVGNIYASESLYRACISPKLPANRLTFKQVQRLLGAIREVLAEAIEFGSTVPVNLSGAKSDGLFYFGRAPGSPDFYEERLRVYDRAGKPCQNCGRPIQRIFQAARSTFFCQHCQKV